MWVVVSVDMEGASGVVSAKQIRENTPQWQEARRLLVSDVNAAVEGALAGGADHVVLHDSHGIEFINLPLEALHERAQVIYGIPTALITGDDATCDELREWCPDIETAVVKYSLSRYAGRCLPLGEARTLIRAAAERAVATCRRHRLPELATPVELEVQFVAEQVARIVALIPGVTRKGLDWVCYTAPDMPTAYRCLNAMFGLASSRITLPAD